MKGFIAKRMWAKAVLLCSGLPLAATGCYEYRDLVDPCYPQRYNYMAEKEVNAALDAQVCKGHALDQTVWNYDFDAGTDHLNAMGIDKLASLARRLPQPDPILYLQTAQVGEVGYDPVDANKLQENRLDLDARRIAAIQKFMMVQTAGRGCAFQVAVIDPSEVGLPAIPVSSTIVQLYTTHYKGNLGGGGAAGGASPSGGAGASPGGR